MCLSSSEFLMYLMSRVRHSEASRFLTLEYIGQVGEHEFRMSLNGPDGDFRVEVGPHTSRICLMGERIWFISESHREGRAYQNIADDVVYGGPIDGRTHAEVIGLFLEVVGILAGATGLFHARAQEGRCDLDSGTRHYDVYVRNAHTGPYRRTLANINFHVNCDADWGADGAEGGAEPASAAPSPEGGTPRSGPGRYCPVGDGPTGLMGRDMDPTRADVEWFMRRLGRSDVSRLLSLDLQEDSGGGFCLCLDGPGDGFYVGFDSHLFDVCNAWERIWFTSESHRPSPDSQDSWGEIVYDGPVEGEDRVELFDLAYETVRVLAGATGAFHDEIRTKEGWNDLGSEARFYDVYVRNAHTGPYRKTLANISFHVNCDADWGAGEAEGGAGPAPAAPAPSPEGGMPCSGPGRDCPVGDEPAGLMERDMGPTRADVEWLMRRLQLSEASRFLSYDLDGKGEKYGVRLHLRGRDGGFRVEACLGALRVIAMGECIWFAAESLRSELACPDPCGEVVYGGPVEGRSRVELLGLAYETVRILAGATGLFHARAQEGRCDLDPGTRHYDVYVRNAHTGPYRRTLANISFHVNCDADWGADGADDDSGPIAGGESVPTAPVGGAWTRWGTCRWRLDVQGTLWIAPDTGWEEGAVGRHPNILGRVPWYPQRRRIRAVHALGVVRLGASASGMFCGLENCETMDLTGLDVSGVEDMGALFWRCFSLSSLDVSGWDTSRVRDMSRLFCCCPLLASLDVASWDTSQVQDMSHMFDGCHSLTSLDVSSWDTSRVRDMSHMFEGCYALSSLDVSGWDTSRTESLRGVFRNCSSLVSLAVADWDTAQTTDMCKMFMGCSSLASLDLSAWDTSRVRDMSRMFDWCCSLLSLDVSNWDTSRVRDMSRMFDWCCSLPSLDVSGWNLSGVECVGEMFSSCLRLKRVTLGPGFSFRPCDPLRSTWYACLPDLLSRPPYTGRWSMEDGSHEMSVTELAQSFGPSLAGTWVWVQRRE